MTLCCRPFIHCCHLFRPPRALSWPARGAPLLSPGMVLDDGSLPNISHRYVDARGLRMHIAEAGSGPPVLLLHGFPESWYSWRYQLTALADAGFHAVAPDQRGYCRTGPPGGPGQPSRVADYSILHLTGRFLPRPPGGPGQPSRVADYSILHLTGDVIALMDALGEQQAVVAGHDWGAAGAWHAGLLRA